MKVLFHILFFQELFYGSFLVLLGFFIGIQHGWDSGVRTFLYALLFIQPVILLINWNIIKSVLWSKIKDKRK